MGHIKDWYSKTTYVDVDTGEIISKKLANREYIIIKKSKKVEIKDIGHGIKIGNIEYLNECQRNRQQKLF